MLLFRRQALTDDEQIAFSRRFGPLEVTIRSINSQARTLPEIANLANVDAEDQIIPAGDKRNLFNAGNQMWHTDSSFKRVPALASLLSGREVPPEGGETQYASMRVAYERLPMDLQRHLEGKVAIRPSRRRWCAPIRQTAARRTTWPRMPARSSACRRARRAR